MKPTEIVHLQRALNRFTAAHPRLGHPPILEDGDFGPSTRKRIKDVKYDLGYVHVNDDVDANFFKRMNHPTRVDPEWKQTKEVVARGKKRRAKRRLWVLRNKFKAFLHSGVGTFDDIPVAKTAIPVLNWCRANGWNGRLVSGFRTPAFSESLCFRMCGRPSCPGQCAGRATNHAFATPERFALDVSDFLNFAVIVSRCPIQPKMHNDLPHDLVHFSPSGR